MAQLSPLQMQLKKRLQDNGLSANALEKRAGLKPSAVQNILQGKSKHPTAVLLQAISKELNCSVSDLLDQNQSEKQEKPIEKVNWNSKLYVEAIQLVEDLLSKEKIEVTKEVVLKYADEIYRYSLKEGNLDHRFAQWLIEQYLLPNQNKISPTQ